MSTMTLRRPLERFDWVLLGLTAAVLLIGLANLYSACRPGPDNLLPGFFVRQLAALGVALVALGVALIMDPRRFENLAPLLYGGVLALMASTLVFAPVINGSRSWLIYGPLSFQPAELGKVGMILMLARHFHRNPPIARLRLRDLMAPVLIVAAPVGVIALQRDLGVAMLTLLVGISYLLVLRISMRVWALVSGLAALVCTLAWQFVLREYQRDRILDFLDPSRDPLSSGYQAIQSRIAVGSGGFLGQGYIEGPQTQNGFLPTQHSDFAFSVLAEEWGFLGCAVLLAVYLGMLVWGLRVASNARDSFCAMLAVGVVGMLFWPAAVNIAMVLGLAPVVGIPFPLISQGGSQLLANLIALGFLMNVSMRRSMF